MTVTVPLPQGGYSVHIQPAALRQTGALLAPLGIDRWAVTTDETVAALYGGAVLDSLRSAGLSGQLLTFPAGEAHKTPETWLSLCRQLAQEGFTRSDGLLALGGGVTGDMAGFVAACYQRGMALAQLPTTLLSQVDSAVGGKTAVDLPESKNLLGAFYQPRLVIADPDCLTTLPRRELRCGMAEIIKYGFIQDAGLLDALETDTPNWTAIIARCLTIKAALVAADERDTGVQVAYDRLLALLERWELPCTMPFDTETVSRYLARDKKCEGDTLHAVLLRAIGDAYVEDVPLAALQEGLA